MAAPRPHRARVRRAWADPLCVQAQGQETDRRAFDLRVTDNLKRFSGLARVIGLQPGHFPLMIETDVRNGDPTYLNRSILDNDGNFVGVTYRQSGGCEVSVFLD
jgi:hypothetical protein